MVTTTAAVTPEETVDQGKLAAALRAAGLAEVETATRRRAEYSSDASNYRVIPEVVAFPRSADEIAAAMAVCRELNAPIVTRGGGTSIAGNSLSAGLVLHAVSALPVCWAGGRASSRRLTANSSRSVLPSNVTRATESANV